MTTNVSDGAFNRPASTTPSSSSHSPHRITSAVSDGIDGDARPQKRQKTQACVRCRRRKQKCDYRKPCGNCTKADEPCYTAPPIHQESAHSIGVAASEMTNQGLPDRVGHLSALEERISRIEEIALRSAPGNDHPTTGTTTVHEPVRTGVRATLPSMLEEEHPLSMRTPAVALLGAFASPTSDLGSPLRPSETVHRNASQGDIETLVDRATEETLFNIYNEKVQWRYPFIRLHQLRDSQKRPKGPCTAFFLSMIYSISLLLEKTASAGYKQEDIYRTAMTRYLSHVFNQPDRLLHIQAYLMLAMHAVYSPCTERIITITSAAMRSCVMAQLHSCLAEPDPVDVATRIRIQLRRRVFWCAYKLDRTVAGTYHLPVSIPDSQITVKMYANVDDAELDEKCHDAFPDEVQGVARFTDVSAALQVVYCRQIQSEILNSTLHRDFSEHLDGDDRWRHRVLEKLDRWRSLWDLYADGPSQMLTSNEWINMMYSYSLSMLYRPTKSSVLQSAGAWTVKACVQACLIFRKFQKDTVTTELWLGLIAQFKCGVALLYTFFATPPQVRPPVYEHPDVAEAVRACSITLTLIAEHWPQSKCIRDTFDILAREIPLFEHESARAPPATRRVRPESRNALVSLLKQLEPIVVHRDTLRMIKEIATEEFPSHIQPPKGPVAVQSMELSGSDTVVSQDNGYSSDPQHLEIVADFFQPLSPSGLHMDALRADGEALGDSSLEFPVYFDLLDYM